jgi:hypothetical protein
MQRIFFFVLNRFFFIFSVVGSRVARWYVYFQTKKSKLGKFWRTLEWKMLVYLRVIWNILPPFGKFLKLLGKAVIIWYIFPCFGILFREKSGNPGRKEEILQSNVPRKWVGQKKRTRQLFFHWESLSADWKGVLRTKFFKHTFCLSELFLSTYNHPFNIRYVVVVEYRATVVKLFRGPIRCTYVSQGCQIFLAATTYQNGENAPNDHKNIPIGRKIDQMIIK